MTTLKIKNYTHRIPETLSLKKIYQYLLKQLNYLLKYNLNFSQQSYIFHKNPKNELHNIKEIHSYRIHGNVLTQKLKLRLTKKNIHHYFIQENLIFKKKM